VHFATRKRNYEMRLQCRFSKDMGDEIFLTAEVAGPTGIKGTLVGMTATAILNTVALMNKALGNSFNASIDAAKQKDGSIERTHLVWPVRDADTCIGTPDGEEPPSIMSSFKDTSRRGSPRFFDTKHTYTFVWHSMYLDFVSWEGVGIGMRRGFEGFIGSQPIHLNFYKLRPREERPKDVSVHAETNKIYMMSLVVVPPLRVAKNGIEDDEPIP
jgi:hypothetical protein